MERHYTIDDFRWGEYKDWSTHGTSEVIELANIMEMDIDCLNIFCYKIYQILRDKISTIHDYPRKLWFDNMVWLTL